MKVNNVFQVSYNATVSKPSFGAIHPSKYYLKCEDGTFQEVVSSKVIKTLQRKLIVWLNKAHNDSLRVAQPAKKDADKNIRERLVRFFVNRDKDYRTKSYARSFFTTNRQKRNKAYILTGRSAEIVENAAKPIEKHHSDLKERAGIISDYNGIDFKEAKEYISKHSELERIAIIRDYHNKVRSTINKLLREYNPDNSLFEAYFVPHIKGKNIKYELVDAKFNGK